MKARRRRRLALAAMLALGAAGAVGCSLGFHPSDYEDDPDEGDAAAPLRDGAAGLDGAQADATGDATVTGDGPTGSGQDAIADAIADGPDLRYCQKMADVAFCSDFDEAGSVDQDWFGNETTTHGGGTLTVDTLFAPAIERSTGSAYARIIALDRDAAENSGAYLVKDLATTPRHVVLDLDFSVAQLTGNSLTFVSLYFIGKLSRGMYIGLDYGSTTRIGLVSVSNALDASRWDFSSFDYPVDSASIWNHITIDMNVVTGGAGTLTASVNGAVQQPLSTLYFDPDTAADTLELTVGLKHTDNTVSPSMDVHFDNVVLSYLP